MFITKRGISRLFLLTSKNQIIDNYPKSIVNPLNECEKPHINILNENPHFENPLNECEKFHITILNKKTHFENPLNECEKSDNNRLDKKRY